MQRITILSNNCASVIFRQCNYLSCTPCRKIKIKPEPPPDVKHHWIGPPDEASNIRPIKFARLENETVNEKKYRQKYQELLKWNQEHWADHNRKFFKLKEEFVKQTVKEKLKKDGPKAEKTLSPEEMSIFYKAFLNDNYKMHITYNTEWYKRNIALLWPAFLAFIDKQKRKQVKR